MFCFLISIQLVMGANVLQYDDKPNTEMVNEAGVSVGFTHLIELVINLSLQHRTPTVDISLTGIFILSSIISTLHHTVVLQGRGITYQRRK